MRGVQRGRERNSEVCLSKGRGHKGMCCRNNCIGHTSRHTLLIMHMT
jgi:hypothetical protein